MAARSGPSSPAVTSVGRATCFIYWLSREDHIYLPTLYDKRAKADLTSAERDAWRKAVEEIDNG